VPQVCPYVRIPGPPRPTESRAANKEAACVAEPARNPAAIRQNWPETLPLRVWGRGTANPRTVPTPNTPAADHLAGAPARSRSETKPQATGTVPKRAQADRIYESWSSLWTSFVRIIHAAALSRHAVVYPLPDSTSTAPRGLAGSKRQYIVEIGSNHPRTGKLQEPKTQLGIKQADGRRR
jgi:hypothetical protein